jgi:hypothetical protein
MCMVVESKVCATTSRPLSVFPLGKGKGLVGENVPGSIILRDRE